MTTSQPNVGSLSLSLSSWTILSRVKLTIKANHHTQHISFLL